MITLPVTAQMYHSLVQQQMPNNDNTVCVTPMQVQNFISSNNLCGSNLNSSTTYIMTANNRNVINLPMQTSVKTVISNPTTIQSIYTPKSRTIMRKSFVKKKVVSLAVTKTKPIASSSPEGKKSINNNSIDVANKNRKTLQLQKVEKLQTSQIKSEMSEDKNNRLIDDQSKAKAKKKDEASVETE